MRFSLIIIGNELLNGKIQDLNTHFLASELFQRGFELRTSQLIQDNESEFQTALSAHLANSEIVIITGGLGPTKDDLTKKMLAKFFGLKMTFHQEAYDLVKSHYQRANRTYDKEKSDYHNLPQEFTALYNPQGNAPGIFAQKDEKKIFCLPGVPSEFESMLLEEVFPPLEKISEKKSMRHLIYKTWKLHESQIFNDVCPKLWEELEKYGEVSSLPHLLGVDIAVKIDGIDHHKLQTKQKAIHALMLNSPLKDYIWHIGPETVAEVIINQAKKKNLKIGFAESCTGGLLASKITDISGSSSVFWGSIISYSNEVKINTLNVSPKTLETYGAVSKETALEMAIGAKQELGVDIVVTTTGIAGPGGATDTKPVGTVGIGFATKNRSDSELLYFRGKRTVLKERFATAALFKLLEVINEF